MKAKCSLLITALVMFCINFAATSFYGFANVVAMLLQSSITSPAFLWAAFNSIVGIVVALFLICACIGAFRGKGDLLAACAFFLCAVQNFLSFVPNWQYVLQSIGRPLQLFNLVFIDWIVGLAYVAIAIAALMRWKAKTAGVIGASVVLGVRVFAFFRALVSFLKAGVPLSQFMVSMVPNFLFCILMLQLGILLFIMAQDKKTE